MIRRPCKKAGRHNPPGHFIRMVRAVRCRLVLYFVTRALCLTLPYRQRALPRHLPITILLCQVYVSP
jgi:hypothetical protein